MADITDIQLIQDFLLGKIFEFTLNKTEEPDEPEEPPYVEGQWYNTADISWIDPNKPMVALSFDDGPVGVADTDYSMRIQNAIADNGFHATFFYVINLWGRNLDSTLEKEIIRVNELGFEVANHTAQTSVQVEIHLVSTVLKLLIW